jgi:hypothetical protein
MEVSSISTDNSVQHSSLFIKRHQKESLNPIKELKNESKKASNPDQKVPEKAPNPKKNSSKKEIKSKKEKKSPSVSVIESIKEISSHNASNSNSDLVIEIDEENNPKKKKRPYSAKAKKKKFIKPKSQYLQGYNPFIFYEKEKCYNIDFSKVNARDYIKEIAYQWKTMTEEEKEPYVKLAIDFKKNSTINQGEEKMLQKKRKRNIVKDVNKKKKKKKEKKNEMHKSLSESLKSVGFADSNSAVKRNKSETKLEKMKLEKDDCGDDVKNYINSVLIPFVKKSYHYFMKKGMKLK